MHTYFSTEWSPTDPDVLVLIPADETVLACPLKGFTVEQVIGLNSRMRECLAQASTHNLSLHPVLVTAFKEQLKL